ncbi:hypothetical protein [Streptomyces malaysiensis]
MEKALVVLGSLLLVGGLVVLDGAIIMWLVAWWHSMRPAVPAIGLGEALLISLIGQLVTFRPQSKS